VLTSKTFEARFLFEQGQQNSDLSLASPDHLETFLAWLVAAKAGVPSLTNGERQSIIAYIDRSIRDMLYAKRSTSKVTGQVKKLPLFSRSTHNGSSK